MKFLSFLKCAAAGGILSLSVLNSAAQVTKPVVGSELFPDKVVAKGKGVEVKASQVEEAYLAFKANRAASQRNIPDNRRQEIEAQILDRLIATQLFLNRATEADKTEGKATAEKFVGELRKRSISDAAFERQLRAEGVTPEQFQKQVLEQAIVKSVIDREIKSKQVVTPEQLRKYYEENAEIFQDPERYKVSHILVSTRDEQGNELLPEAKVAKRQKLEGVASLAREGRNWTNLVKEFSEDAPTKDNGGEYVFARGQMPLEFEAATISLKDGQVSDIVTTRYGYHLIKLLEKIPAQKVEFSKVEERIRETLLQEAVQKELPPFVEKLKKEANVVLTPVD